MHSAADIVDRLQYAATRRRAPLWLAVLLPWCLLLSVPGVLLAGVWIWWDYRRQMARVGRHWSGWLDAAVPALEDSSALLAQADTALARLQRARLLRRLDMALRDDAVTAIVHRRVRFGWYWLAASVLPALALLGWQHAGGPVSARELMARLAAETSEVVVRVTPPRYTGQAAYQTTPRALTVPQYSVVQWCLRAPQPVNTPIELSDGRALAIGRQCARWTADEAVFWRWRGARYELLVRPDQPPRISVTAPLVAHLAADATSTPIRLSVRDDYRVRRAWLHLTVAHAADAGRTTERDVPLPESGDWARNWSMEELGMQSGDTLYFQVRATDTAEHPQTSVSPTYTVQLGDVPVPQDADIADDGAALAASYRRPQRNAVDPVPAPVRALIAALGGAGALPASWRTTALDWIDERLQVSAQKLAAQRAVQDVGDGCLRCRAPLRAWLRMASPATPLLHAQADAGTPFERAWSAEGER